MLTEIPCCHALAAMKFLNVDPVNFISFWYKKETYAEVYNTIIYPVNGEQVWERTEMSDVVPPPTKKMLGRPKKKRRLEPWEVMKNKTQLGQTGLKKKCGICHKLGHNRKSCIEKPSEQGPSAKRPPHPRPSQQAPSQATTSAPGPPQEAPNQAAISAPGPSQAARRTTRSTATFSRPNTRLKLQSIRGRFWKP